MNEAIEAIHLKITDVKILKQFNLQLVRQPIKVFFNSINLLNKN